MKQFDDGDNETFCLTLTAEVESIVGGIDVSNIGVNDVCHA